MTDPYSLRISATPRPRSGPEGLVWWVTLGLPWFRAMPFACLERLELTVGERVLSEDQLTIRSGERLMSIDELRTTGRYWGIEDSIQVGVASDVTPPEPGTLVQAEVVLRLPESADRDAAPRKVARASTTFTTGASSSTKLGVCSFSFAGELRRGRSLRSCLDQVGALGGFGGIELLGAQVADGYPTPTGADLDRLRGWVRDAGLVPLVYGSYTDPGRQLRPADDDDVIAWAATDLDVAAALGCDFVRINFPAQLSVYERVARLAQERDLVVLNELHAMTTADAHVQQLLEVYAQIDSPHLGLTLDLSSVMSALPRGFIDTLLRPDLPEQATRIIVDGWMSGQPESEARADIEALGDEVAKRALTLLDRSRRLFRRSDPGWLADILPLVRVVHGKFFEIVDGSDASVPIHAVLDEFRAAHFDGHILAEFEAHLWDDDPDTFGELARFRDLVSDARL